MYRIIHPCLYISSIEGKQSPEDDHGTSKHDGVVGTFCDISVFVGFII